MSRLLAVSRRLAFGVAAMALTAGLGAGARAEVAYAFATETISNVTPSISSGGTLTVGAPTALSSTGAVSNNASDGHNGTFDAPKSYVGTPPKAPENFFAKWATFGAAAPLPGGTLPTGVDGGALGSFTRGDTVTSPAGSGSVVAESYLNTVGGIASGTGGNSVTVPFTVGGSGGAVSLTYNYVSDLYSAVLNPNIGGDTASASLSFNITIKDANGNLVGVFPVTQAANPGYNNSPPNGPEVIRSGTETDTATTPTGGALTLAAGTYTVNFGLKAQTIVTTAVPEPATIAMALTALPLLGFGLLRRRNRNRKVQA